MKYPDASEKYDHDKYFVCFCKQCEKKRGAIENWKLKKRLWK
tara:strand:- start:625 stop:750 length:126 start_codon:yes stop_codon:yes gene_type:complete